MRADRLSCYGYERKTTPHIDALASDGIRFKNAFSQAISTVESSVSILTGLYTEAHGVTSTLEQVPPEAPRLDEALSAVNYDTGAVSSITQVSKRRNFDSEFDRFDELFDDYEVYERDAAKLCTDAMVEWIEQKEDNAPFFGLVWNVGTHEPYHPREGEFASREDESRIDGSVESLSEAGFEQRERVSNLYDDSIRHTDAEFGRLCSYLKEQGLYDDTIIVFTADHGELLSEHARLEHVHPLVERLTRRIAPDLCDRYAMFDRTARVGHLSVIPYDELIHVPLVVKPAESGPGSGGEVRDQLVQLIDVAPTLTDIVDAPFDSQGTSLMPVVSDGQPVNDYVYSDSTVSWGLSRFRSVRSHEYKYVNNELEVPRFSERGKLKLDFCAFSVLRELIVDSDILLQVDEGEVQNVAGEEPDVLSKFKEVYRTWRKENREVSLESVGQQPARLDDDVKTQLEELGYVVR